MLKTLSDSTTKFVSEVRLTGTCCFLFIYLFIFEQLLVGVLSLTFIFVSLQHKNLPIENTTDCLSTMAMVCKVMLETP